MLHGASPRATELFGIDINRERLPVAKAHYRERVFVQCAGESLPFGDATFDRVISKVALPYMNIETALREVHRVLVPGGGVAASMQPLRFKISELFHDAFPKPGPTLFRLYALANGILFHCTGTTMKFLNGRMESFQTERGMRTALKRAGFVDAAFRREPGVGGEKFLVEARKSAILKQ